MSSRDIGSMCARVIRSTAPLHYGFVDGMNVRDGRVHNCPASLECRPEPRVARDRRNHKTGERG
jgi:hypothetical protein